MFVGVFSCVFVQFVCCVHRGLPQVYVSFCVGKPTHPWNCGTGCSSVLETEHSGAFAQPTGLFAGLKVSVQASFFP